MDLCVRVREERGHGEGVVSEEAQYLYCQVHEGTLVSPKCGYLGCVIGP